MNARRMEYGPVDLIVDGDDYVAMKRENAHLTAENARLTQERDAGWAEVARVASLVLRAEAERDALAGQVAALRAALGALAVASDPFARRMQRAVEHQEKWRADHPGQMPLLLNSESVPVHWTYTPTVGEARRLVSTLRAALAAVGGKE